MSLILFRALITLWSFASRPDSTEHHSRRFPNGRTTKILLTEGTFEIATKIAYRNGGRIGIGRSGAMDCAMVAAPPVLPPGYLASASRIADRRMILAGYRLADLLTRVAGE